MPDFDVTLARGVEQRRWTDPAGPNGEASRIRPHPGFEQLYFVAKVGVMVVFKLLPYNTGGAPPPDPFPDTSLGGRLFVPFLTEGFGPPIFTSPPGFSSQITWTPSNSGHHIVGIRRPLGGAILVPIDVEQ